MIYLHNLIHMSRYDPKPTQDIKIVHFLHDPRNRHKLNTKLTDYN
jgi:hypothetical protein